MDQRRCAHSTKAEENQTFRIGNPKLLKKRGTLINIRAVEHITVLNEHGKTVFTFGRGYRGPIPGSPFPDNENTGINGLGTQATGEDVIDDQAAAQQLTTPPLNDDIRISDKVITDTAEATGNVTPADTSNVSAKGINNSMTVGPVAAGAATDLKSYKVDLGSDSAAGVVDIISRASASQLVATLPGAGDALESASQKEDQAIGNSLPPTAEASIPGASELPSPPDIAEVGDPNIRGKTLTEPGQAQQHLKAQRKTERKPSNSLKRSSELRRYSLAR